MLLDSHLVVTIPNPVTQLDAVQLRSGVSRPVPSACDREARLSDEVFDFVIHVHGVSKGSLDQMRKCPMKPRALKPPGVTIFILASRVSGRDGLSEVVTSNLLRSLLTYQSAQSIASIDQVG